MYGNAGIEPYKTPGHRMITAQRGNDQRRALATLGLLWRLSHLASVALTATGFYISWKIGDPSPLVAAGLSGLIVLVVLRLLRPSAWPSPHPVIGFVGGLLVAAAVAVPMVAFVDDEDTLFPGQDRIEHAVLDVRESFLSLDDSDDWRATRAYIRSEINSRID